MTSRRRTLGAPALLIAGGAAAALFILLGVAAQLAHGPIGPDAAVHSALISSRDAVVNGVAHVVTFTGSAPFVYPMACVVAAVVWLRRRREAALAFVVAFLGGALVCGVVKTAIDRPRPDPTAMLGAPATGMSFPSGHTTMGTLLFVGAAVVLTVGSSRGRRIVAVAAAAVWAAMIAWSRLLLGYHWLTDVLGGALLASSLLLSLAWCVQVARLPQGLRLRLGEAHNVDIPRGPAAQDQPLDASPVR